MKDLVTLMANPSFVEGFTPMDGEMDEQELRLLEEPELDISIIGKRDDPLVTKFLEEQ